MANSQNPAVQDQSGRVADTPASPVSALVRDWSAKSGRLGWPAEVTWDVEATRLVAAACLKGADLQEPLRALADQRLDEAATLADYERDVAALAACVQQHAPAGPAPDELTVLGKEAGRWVTARDHTIAQLVDPSSSFRTRTAFLADLTHPAFRHAPQYVWIARWSTGTTPWSSSARRMSVATHLTPRLETGESAAYLGPATLAVLITSPQRSAELEHAVSSLPELPPLAGSTVCRPPLDDVPDLARWLLDTFPELVSEPAGHGS